jgi:hypothetical protein
MASVGFTIIFSSRTPGPFGMPSPEGYDYSCVFNNNTLVVTSTHKYDIRYPSHYSGGSHTQEYKFKSILNKESIEILQRNLTSYYESKKTEFGVPFPTQVCRDLDNLVNMHNSLKEKLKEESKLEKDSQRECEFLQRKYYMVKNKLELLQEENKKLKESKSLYKFEQNQECEEIKEKYDALNANYDILDEQNKKISEELEKSQFEHSNEIKDLKYKNTVLTRENSSLQKTNKKLLSVMKVLEKKNKSVKNNVFKEKNVKNLMNNHTTFKRSIPKPRPPPPRGVRSRSAKLQPVENV